jgi:class 3 adenylate cyclase/tetratricopeptide (TPR) repeat protein
MSEDVARWLGRLGLERYHRIFIENEIEYEDLGALTESDLKELGIPIGPRRRLLTAITQQRHEVPIRCAAPEIVKESLGTELELAENSTATEDRRPVAVLFIDLTGSTALSEKLDPEELHRVIGIFLDAVDDIVKSLGGTVDKHLGDGCLATFGAPVAHGNDVLRAATAACLAMKSMGDISQKAGHPLAAHAGLAVGEVFVGRVGSGAAEYTVIGDTVNLASRLCSRAQPGEVLIDTATADAVEGDAQIEDLGAEHLQGFSRSIRVWRLACMRDARINANRPPLFGRGAELAQATGVLNACLAEGFGGAILLRGEPGIGKTRLLDEVEALALGKGFETHKSIILNFGTGTAQDAIGTLARSLAGFQPDDSFDQRFQKSVEAAQSGNLAPNQHACLNEMLDVWKDDELKQIFDAMDNDARNDAKRQALIALLKCASTTMPQLVAVEDIHWADQKTLSALESIIGASRDLPAVVMLTTRTSGDPFDTTRRDVSNLSIATIDLAPLRPQAAVDLARLNLGDREDLLQMCVERAGGNPLFLLELSRSRVAAPASLPATLHQVILARIDELGPIDQEALRAASVFGQRFELENLRRLIGRDDFDCTRLLARHLVKRDGEAFLFAHALVQEGVYRTLLKPDRVALHAQAAELFTGKDPILYARHLDLSGSSAAARAMVAAAEFEREHYRPDTAIKLADRAAELANDGEDAQDAEILRAKLLVDLGRTADAIAAWDRAVDLATDAGARGRALLGKAQAHRLSNETAEAFALLKQAEPLLEQSNRKRDLAWLSHLRGNLHFLIGEQDECSSNHRLAIDRAEEAQSRDVKVAALCGLADAVYARGAMETARRYFSDGIAAAREIGQTRTEAANLAVFGVTHFFCLDFDAALIELERSVDLSHRIGHLRAEFIARSAIEQVLFQRGDLLRCRAHYEVSRELIDRMDAQVFLGHRWEKAARIAVLEGDEERAQAQFQKAAEISRKTSFRFVGPRVTAQAALFVNDLEYAQNLLDEALEGLGKGALGHNYLIAYPDAIDFALCWGQWNDATRYIRALETFGSEDQLTWSKYYGDRGRALVALGKGEADAWERETLSRLLNIAQSLDWNFETEVLRPALEAAEKRVSWRLPRRIEIAERAVRHDAS